MTEDERNAKAFLQGWFYGCLAGLGLALVAIKILV